MHQCCIQDPARAEDEPEEEIDEEELDQFTNILYRRLGFTGVNPLEAEMIKDRIRRRIARMSIEKRFRLLAYLR